MKNYKKFLSCLLSVMIIMSAGVVIPASVPAVSAKTKSAKAVKKLKKPTKVTAKLKKLSNLSKEINFTEGYYTELTWKKVKNAKKYEVYRAKLNAKGKGKFKKLTTVKKAKYGDTTLKSGSYYKYKVKALKGKVKSKLSSASKKVGYMLAPSVLAGLNEECTAVRVKFSQSDGAAGYKLYKSTDKGKSYKLLKNSKSFKKKDGDFYYDDSDVKLGGHYYYYLVAYNSVMSSKKSSVGRAIYKDYSYAVQVGDTKTENLPITFAAMGFDAAVESEDESIVKASVDTDATGKSELVFTGVKAGYTYVKIRIESSGETVIENRVKVKVTEEPVYDVVLKKGESTELYEFDALKESIDLLKLAKMDVKITATSNDPAIARIENPDKLNFKIVGVSEGEVLVKVKITASYSGETMELLDDKCLVKVE